jgi:hypothetical protein
MNRADVDAYLDLMTLLAFTPVTGYTLLFTWGSDWFYINLYAPLAAVNPIIR